MHTFTQWAEHYGYDPASREAQADYAEYVAAGQAIASAILSRASSETRT